MRRERIFTYRYVGAAVSLEEFIKMQPKSWQPFDDRCHFGIPRTSGFPQLLFQELASKVTAQKALNRFHILPAQYPSIRLTQIRRD